MSRSAKPLQLRKKNFHFSAAPDRLQRFGAPHLIGCHEG